MGYYYPLLHTAHLRRDSDATMANSWVFIQVEVLDRLSRLVVATANMRNRTLGYLD